MGIAKKSLSFWRHQERPSFILPDQSKHYLNVPARSASSREQWAYGLILRSLKSVFCSENPFQLEADGE